MDPHAVSENRADSVAASTVPDAEVRALRETEGDRRDVREFAADAETDFDDKREPDTRPESDDDVENDAQAERVALTVPLAEVKDERDEEAECDGDLEARALTDADLDGRVETEEERDVDDDRVAPGDFEEVAESRGERLPLEETVVVVSGDADAVVPRLVVALPEIEAVIDSLSSADAEFDLVPRSLPVGSRVTEGVTLEVNDFRGDIDVVKEVTEVSELIGVGVLEDEIVGEAAADEEPSVE